MRTNVLNDLSNVVKKGTILAGSAAAAVDSCAAGSTTLAEYPGNHPVITQLSPRNHPLLDAIWKHVAMIFAVLVMSIANIGMAWGTTFTPAQIAASGGTTTNNIKVSTSLSAGTAKKCSTQSSVAAISLSSSSDGNYNSNYIEIQATSGTITSLSLQARGNGDGNTGAMVIVFWSGDAQATYSSYSTSFNYLDRAGTYCDDAGYVEISVPSNTKTVRLYKKIYVKDGAISGASGKATVQAPGTYNIFGISALASTSCLAADLTAANITSNGDQVVGTGITFSKVGSPASGDTWYWQTSSTGTDKTYNASSNYTTATTAGSYTVYLRAYNSGSDCWGTAISKTNTIFCSNVYNGENVAKGSTTASGWTIYSSSSMAKTSGSSNGYSYWYQASSGSSDYVQFDGSASLVSGDKIIIRWTHTNGSNKTLTLTINGSSASLTSGSTASNSVLTEAVYNVTSTTEVTSIKLNSSSSKGCIIYQVSIVKAACDDEPSCEAPSSVGITGTSSYLPGQNISLTAAATGGSGTPTTYQWYHRGVAIDGATSATYTKSNCTIDDAGNYTCKVTMGGSCSTTSPNFAVRVYSVKVWSNGGGSVIGNYPLTYQSSNNGRAVISTLSASTTYEFKVIDNVGGTSDSTIYYGNGGTIHHNTAIDPATWDFGSTTATNCKLVTGVETGDFTFDVDITHNGTGAGFYVTVNVAYPTKTIYLTPGVWNAEGAKFAIHYYDANGGTGWTDFLTANDCGMSAEIPVWDGVKMIAGRFNSTKASTGNWDDKWNQTNDITVSSYNSVVITGWDAGDYTYNSNFSTPTYTISYNKGTNGTGSKANETKTCGVDFTLPGSTFTYAGHSQDGWATTDGGATAYALSGSYTTNDDEEFFPHWKCNTPTITDNGDNTVTITVPAGTTVRYTTDGSAPTSSNGTEYSSAFTIDATVTVKAIAYQSGCTDSEVASQACTYHAPVEGCIDANSTNFGAGNSSGDASKTLADGTVVAMNKCTNSASSVSIGGNILFTAPTGKAFETFSFVATCGSAGKTNYYKINGGSQQSLESSTTTAKTYTITIPGATNATTIQIIKNGTTPAVSSFCYTLKDICTSPTTAFANGAYTVGGSALDLSTLISGKQGSGTITYTVKNANGTGAAIDGSNFTATSAGTATVTATQAANGGYCEKVMDATITVSAAGPSGDCITITNFATTNSSNTLNVYKGTISDANKYLGKTTSSSTVGKNSGADLLLKYKSSITIYNAPAAETNFTNITEIHFDVKANDNTKRSGFEVYVGATKVATISGGDGGNTVFNKDSYTTLDVTGLEQLTGYVRITSTSSSGAAGYDTYIDNIQICTSSLPACTTPELPDLSNQTVCEGSNGTSWNAAITNSGSLVSGETVAYSWVKKGGSTPVSSVATYQPTDVTEAMAGTYVVTATVSADGKASKSASQEVELSVTEETEVTNITADKATVYPGNSVTLTATANVTPNSWQWYTCASAEGAGAAIISGAESASYTIASAGAAGTYYYKAVATGSCGTAERVYTLIVSAASECEKYFWFVYAADATSNGVINNRDNFFGSSPKTGSSNSSTYKFTLDGTEYTATRNTGDNTFSISFTVPEGSTATLALNCKGSSSKPIYLIPTSGDPVLITDNSSNAAHVVENIAAGTYKVGAKTDASASWTLAGMAVQVCTASTCTDATPTITAANTTVCVGSELSISSTGYETGATFQWQKLNSSTSTWDNISGATSATYTVATAAAEHAGSYRLVATKGCARTSNTVTISVPSAPVFGSLGGARSVMTTSSLSITDVEASDATSYIWYKSANNTFEPGTDEQIGTSKDLIIGAVSEAANSTFYLFCVASNSCGSTTSGAITVNVTAYVEEDCATRDNMASAEFGFVNTSAGQGSYSSTACWTMNSNSKYLTYTAPEGKYFKTAKVTIASNSESKASYNWSTNGGTDYTAVSLTINSTLTERTINLSAHGNVNAIQIGRNFDSKGSSGGTLYVSKICFEYTEACTATTVTPSTSSVNYEMGGEWSNPTFTLSVAGTLTYSSSNEDIASVDDDGTITFNGEAGTVTITASYAGDETYCASTGSYTITVSCPGGAPKIVADGSVDMSGCNSSVTLLAKTQDDGDFADGTYQWFRNGEEIDGATSASYTARQAGTYTVARTNGTGCTSPSTNSAIVTSETTEPEVERLVPFQYYHVDKTYSDQMKMRHLFAVKNSGTLDGKHFKMYVSRNGGAATDVTSSAALVVEPNRDGQHIDTVMVDLNKLSGKYSENDEVVYTCKAIDCSGNVSDVYKNTITMRVIDATPTLALIISSDSVGDDFFRYKAKNLQEQTGGSAWSGEWPLYTYLKTRYNITPVNGYADFYKYNYEPFDILLLTDFPKTKPYGNPKNDNQKKQNTLARKALDDMADLCDFRPLLSFKTHMVQEETDLGHVSKWQAKGFTSNAVVPKTCQLRADIVCYAHPMFASLSTASSEINENKDNEAQKVFTLLSGEGYESGKVDGKEPKKGIQGFEVAAADNFVIIAYSHFDATATDLTGADAGKVHWEDKGKDRNLVAMCERQANIEARMILFSLNAGAHSKLTNAGMAVVDSCLQYLLDSDPLHVSDCSLVFDNNEGNGDGNWSTATNWLPTREEIPHANLAAHIKAPCTVNIPNASALNIRIEDEGSLIIPQGAALMVVNTIKRQDGRELSPTEVGDIHIGSNEDGNGTLIFNNNDGDTKARVDMYSKAKTAEPDAETGVISAADSKWQYIGTPHNDIGNAQRNYYDSWLYQYDTESQGWTVIENGGPLVPFRGYCVTHPAAPVVFDMEGTLVATTSYDISVPANKYVVAANSWVAPIDINAITSDDMEGFSDQAIYFFNTGSDPDKEGELDGGDRWAAGTYVSVPIHSAPYTGDDHIPSMQGFYVWSETAGTLHLDYEKHVRGTTRDNILSGRMHAPRRAVAENSEPNVLKIFARGSRYDDRLIVLEREDFTRRYESGWDGEAWGGSDLSPMVYITNEAGVDEAVSAIPEFEGTVITFKAGEDSEYRLDFVYDDEESLYLFDTENNTYTQIMTGESYYFSTDDKAPHSRFILTRRGPQIATGVGEVPSDQVQGTKAKKLLIENKMYILLNGALYDATGKAVK